MISDRTGLEQGAFLVFNNAADVGVQFIPDVVGKKRLTIFRGEDQMYEDLGEGLWQKVTPLSGFGKLGPELSPNGARGESPGQRPG